MIVTGHGTDTNGENEFRYTLGRESGRGHVSATFHGSCSLSGIGFGPNKAQAKCKARCDILLFDQMLANFGRPQKVSLRTMTFENEVTALTSLRYFGDSFRSILSAS